MTVIFYFSKNLSLGTEKTAFELGFSKAARELTTKSRNKLSDSSFVFQRERRYPIHDEAHARNALARVSQFGTKSEKDAVRAAVHSRYPGIGKEASLKRSLLSAGSGAFMGTMKGGEQDEYGRTYHREVGTLRGTTAATAGYLGQRAGKSLGDVLAKHAPNIKHAPTAARVGLGMVAAGSALAGLKKYGPKYEHEKKLEAAKKSGKAVPDAPFLGFGEAKTAAMRDTLRKAVANIGQWTPEQWAVAGGVGGGALGLASSNSYDSVPQKALNTASGALLGASLGYHGKRIHSHFKGTTPPSGPRPYESERSSSWGKHNRGWN